MKTSPMKRFGLMAFMSAMMLFLMTACGAGGSNDSVNNGSGSNSAQTVSSYQPSAEEKEEMRTRFTPLLETNKETIAHVYIPGSDLDEPVVQTSDNATYLDKTFDGGNEPYMGTVFMDMDNKKDFSDRLTWLFGHARGSKVGDHRMFNDVNYFSDSTYFNEHKYVVVETPTRKFYYEAMCMVIVPETTAFYRTSFKDDKEFTDQLTRVREDAQVKNDDIKVSAKDKYLVLSTCREEDETIRANLYLRQIPDAEMEQFAKDHASELTYVAKR